VHVSAPDRWTIFLIPGCGSDQTRTCGRSVGGPNPSLIGLRSLHRGIEMPTRLGRVMTLGGRGMGLIARRPEGRAAAVTGERAE